MTTLVKPRLDKSDAPSLVFALVITVLSLLVTVLLTVAATFEVRTEGALWVIMLTILGAAAFLLSTFTGLLSIKRSNVLVVPALAFPAFGTIQGAFILSGMLGPNADQVAPWHALLLIVLMVVVPWAVGALSWRRCT